MLSRHSLLSAPTSRPLSTEGGVVRVAGLDDDDHLTVRVRHGGVELATRPSPETIDAHADLLACVAAEALPERSVPR
jgi:hypothetical protein